jgi:3-oxoacyl-[acyl-carrier-protein] synthase III
MRYTRAHIEGLGYELAPVVVTSDELEARLEPLYRELHLQRGQVEALTGIEERRWWEPGMPVSRAAAMAGRKALAQAGATADDLDAVVYAGVCRENFEPATACAVAAELGAPSRAAVYDISNACLGMMNGIVDLANRIELGQIRAGLVVACETARDINETMIERMLQVRTMEFFTESLTTLTGGSGAAAVLVTDGSFTRNGRRRLLGGVQQSAAEHHRLCRWGLEPALPKSLRQFMSTDSVQVLRHGVELGARTWRSFLDRVGWAREQVDRVICHQVGAGHRDSIHKLLGLPPGRDFSTFRFLGNMGTVSLPLTAALAEEQGFLKPGHRVGFLGIGSGLNCLMLGYEW